MIAWQPDHNRFRMGSQQMQKREPTTPDQILRTALTREQESRDLYGNLATTCHIESVRDLLEKLQGEDAKHVRMIQDMMTKLNMGRSFA
jgi:rubrerythrin